MERKTLIISIFILIAGYSCKSKTENEKIAAAPSNISGRNSDNFNRAFDSVLLVYTTLKSDFVNWDSIKADNSAAVLQVALQNVPYEDLKFDSLFISAAKDSSKKIVQDSKDLIAKNNIEEKRRSFYLISEDLYKLIKTVKYDKQVIYHDKCPMAFNGNEEGWWISAERKINNPYIGNKHPKYKNAMLSCGTIEDSVNYMH